MRRPFYQLVLISFALLACTGGTFTCESSSGGKKDNQTTNK